MQGALFAMPQQRRSQGFTLLEMLIVVAFIAILAGIAMPSYVEHVKKSRRAEAQSYMLMIAARQQQFLVDTRAFAALPPDNIASQPSNVASAYTVTMNTANGPPPTFTITATPKANQNSEKCGTLTIDQTGTKTAAITGCW
jgi:type IV pilus assembly protein PilE